MSIYIIRLIQIVNIIKKKWIIYIFSFRWYQDKLAFTCLDSTNLKIKWGDLDHIFLLQNIETDENCILLNYLIDLYYFILWLILFLSILNFQIYKILGSWVVSIDAFILIILINGLVDYYFINIINIIYWIYRFI